MSKPDHEDPVVTAFPTPDIGACQPFDPRDIVKALSRAAELKEMLLEFTQIIEDEKHVDVQTANNFRSEIISSTSSSLASLYTNPVATMSWIDLVGLAIRIGINVPTKNRYTQMARRGQDHNKLKGLSTKIEVRKVLSKHYSDDSAWQAVKPRSRVIGIVREGLPKKKGKPRINDRRIREILHDIAAKGAKGEPTKK